MYRTEQRKKLSAFFKSHPDLTITAKDLEKALAEGDGPALSTSAIYRNLDRLEQEGIIMRYASKNRRENLYRYVQAESCENRLHLACIKCGKTQHMDNSISSELLDKVMKLDCFQIDTEKTAILGLCDDCRKKETE